MVRGLACSIELLMKLGEHGKSIRVSWGDRVLSQMHVQLDGVKSTMPIKFDS